MAKVSIQIKNPNFCADAAEYLIKNGYEMKEGSMVNNALYFFKDGKAVVVYGDNVDFMLHDAGEPEQRQQGYKRTMAITSISELSLFDWMLMFHVAQIITLRDFIKLCVKSGVRNSTEELFRDMLTHFQIVENSHKSLPICY